MKTYLVSRGGGTELVSVDADDVSISENKLAFSKKYGPIHITTESFEKWNFVADANHWRPGRLRIVRENENTLTFDADSVSERNGVLYAYQNSEFVAAFNNGNRSIGYLFEDKKKDKAGMNTYRIDCDGKSTLIVADDISIAEDNILIFRTNREIVAIFRDWDSVIRVDPVKPEFDEEDDDD